MTPTETETTPPAGLLVGPPVDEGQEPLAAIARDDACVDGLLAVESVEDDRVVVGFANADGSEAGFCGNGARCVGRFAHETGMT